MTSPDPVAEAREALDAALETIGLYNLLSMGEEYGPIERLVRAILAERKTRIATHRHDALHVHA